MLALFGWKAPTTRKQPEWYSQGASRRSDHVRCTSACYLHFPSFFSFWVSSSSTFAYCTLWLHAACCILPWLPAISCAYELIETMRFLLFAVFLWWSLKKLRFECWQCPCEREICWKSDSHTHDSKKLERQSSDMRKRPVRVGECQKMTPNCIKCYTTVYCDIYNFTVVFFFFKCFWLPTVFVNQPS